MRNCLILLVGFLVTAEAQPKAETSQYLVLLKRGPKWLPGKSVAEQPLLKHGRYLKELMDKGTLQMAGPFVDDSGGFIILTASDEAEAKRITENDPGVMDQILVPEVRAVRVMFDASTGKSPFK